MNQLRSAGDAVLYSLTNFFSFLPALVGAVIVLIVGWIIAGFVARLVERGLVRAGFEGAVMNSGTSRFLQRANTSWTASKLLAQLAKWFVFLIFVVAAANLLRMPEVTAILNSILVFIPKLIVALAILVIGLMIANLLAGVVRAAMGGIGIEGSDVLASLTRYAVIGFAVVAALDQIGIATTVVNTLLIGLIGSVALALGLAFGLGGRDVAAKITQSWYESGRTAASRLETRTGGQAGVHVFQPRDQSPATGD